MRDFRKVKPQTARRQRIESKYICLADIGGSRGRRGAPAASIDAALPQGPRVDWPRLGSLAASSAVQRPRLSPLLRPRVLWPLAGPPGSRAEPLAGRNARPHDRARSACRVRVARSRDRFWRAMCAHLALSWSVSVVARWI